MEIKKDDQGANKVEPKAHYSQKKFPFDSIYEKLKISF